MEWTFGLNARYYYKVVYDPTHEKKMIGFILPNSKIEKNIAEYVVPIDEIEKKQHLIFLVHYPIVLKTIWKQDFLNGNILLPLIKIINPINEI